jgi:signal transduction histidine kinase
MTVPTDKRRKTRPVSGVRNLFHRFANLFRRGELTIGVRLTACFLTIVGLMIAAELIAIWQLRQLANHAETLNAADKASSAVVRVHLDVNNFSRRVAELTRSHDTGQFATEAASLRQTFLQHIQDAEQVIGLWPETAHDPLISSTLKTLKVTLPSQIDSEVELAHAGDWAAIQLRLTGQIQDLIDLSSSLVEGVEERVFQERARVDEQTQEVRRRLFIVVPSAWLLSLLVAAGLGWYVTRTITAPLSELTTGARALARGDFGHEVTAHGDDELAVLASVFNHAARQLRRQFDITLEARVAERTRIARELHDTLLQSFHGLLLGFQTVFQLLPERPMDAKDRLGSAIEQAASAITEARDAVQDLRDSIAEGNDLAPAISILGEELATQSSDVRTAFHVTVEGESRNLHPLLRDEIYKIAAEALRNAFQHAQARRVDVEIRYEDEQFQMRVRDDGKGIDAAVLSDQGGDGHFGLRGMRERATLMAAKLTVWSELDAGTEVDLRLPAGIAYGTVQRSS